eukprot:scaffold91354_cov19-Tisochrysis_lutea.AAC.1
MHAAMHVVIYNALPLGTPLTTRTLLTARFWRQALLTTVIPMLPGLPFDGIFETYKVTVKCNRKGSSSKLMMGPYSIWSSWRPSKTMHFFLTHIPECTMVPSSERMMRPQQSGMEWVTRTGSTLQSRKKARHSGMTNETPKVAVAKSSAPYNMRRSRHAWQWGSIPLHVSEERTGGAGILYCRCDLVSCPLYPFPCCILYPVADVSFCPPNPGKHDEFIPKNHSIHSSSPIRHTPQAKNNANSKNTAPEGPSLKVLVRRIG